MNNDLDDDNEDDLGLDDTGFDEFATASSGNKLADLWNNNPAFKIGSVISGLVLVVVGIAVLGKPKVEPSQSIVPTAPEIAKKVDPAVAPTAAYVEAVVDQNTERVEKAISQGGSAIPTLIDTPDAVLALPGEGKEGEEDPLQRWKRLQEQRLQEQKKKKSNKDGDEAGSGLSGPNIAAGGGSGSGVGTGGAGLVAGGTGAGILTPEQLAGQLAQRQQVLQAMSESMSEQMQAILDNKTTVKVNTITFNTAQYIEKIEEEKKAEEEANKPPEDAVETLQPAGEIVYAQLLTEANSDVPGPILAQIVSGPLAGSRALGSFQVSKELLTLNFDKVVIDDVVYPITAVALDPATTLPGMATDVDHHYLKKIILPAAAAFVEGFSSAIAETGRTSVTIDGGAVAEETEEASNDQQVATGVEEAGSELREILDEMADDTETTVIIASGTPLGLLFTEPVTTGGTQEVESNKDKEENKTGFQLPLPTASNNKQ